MVRARLACFALASSLLASGCFHLTERSSLNRRPSTAGSSVTRRSTPICSTTPIVQRGAPTTIMHGGICTPIVQRGDASCCCDDGAQFSVGQGPGFAPPPPDTSVFTSEPPTLPQGPQIIDVPPQGGTAPWSPPQPRIVPVPQNAAPSPYTP